MGVGGRLRHVVVVGGGLAGARAAQELRAQGHDGAVTLVGAENALPYDRPPLSKAVLLGRADDTTLDVDWQALDIGLRLGVRAVGLRPGRLATDHGDLEWDGLVLATGAEPRPLPQWGGVVPAQLSAPGAGRPGLHLLRTAADARRLRAALQPGVRVVVVGAGWIGAEVATAAAAAGCRTTVVEVASAPLATALDPAVGAATVPWYAAAGVELRLGAGVEAMGRGTVVLTDATELAADVVVVGIGVQPSTQWLGGALPLDDNGAVAVDEHLATGLAGVVAAGDCCSWWSRRFGARLHVEHWDDALHAPATAVGTLLGRDVVHDPVPYFWSEQLGHLVQFAGHVRDGDVRVQRGDPAGAHGWSVCWLRGGRLVAVLAVDRPRDLLQGRRAVAEGRRPDADRLGNLQVPLRSA